MLMLAAVQREDIVSGTTSYTYQIPSKESGGSFLQALGHRQLGHRQLGHRQLGHRQLSHCML